MDWDDRKQDVVRSLKVRAGRRRTYFIDIRRTRRDDFYISMTESTRRFDGDGFERHTIYVYKEDFNRVLDGLADMIDYVKTELMPDFDFDEFDRRQEEWEARRAEEREAEDKARDNGLPDNEDY